MMTYEIRIEGTDIIVESSYNLIWRGYAVVKDGEGNTVINAGPVKIACETQEEAYNYMERTFLKDLRRNLPRLLGDLVLSWEVVENEEEIIPPEEGEGE